MKRLLLSLVTLGLCACHSPGQSAAQTSVQTTTVQQHATLSTTDAGSGLAFVALSALPAQAQQTYRLILKGGPFPYRRDGIPFGNREGILPKRQSGTYHEYTVKTPGSSDRGARRIVCAALPECYYTGDHYATFQRIRP
ncbi:ribonuclease [Deinococcus sp. KNUC1210]|uniref:ribonuclease n=1 Tax=Deinococcus sp. KNUC1210 TaxID=2917691 RepID=UPI001EF04BBA|nr:ribonuclease [Deinococcus sp. KNUC1210]ULH16279.1 ribonuclease [Deinococcus sp. KNUC1210]